MLSMREKLGSYVRRGGVGFSKGACVLAAVALLQGACEGAAESSAPAVAEGALFGGGEPMLAPKINFAGFARSATPTDTIDHASPFFASLGTNGRSCGTCHLAGEGWTITPVGLVLRFLFTAGTDPIFRPHDAANAPLLDVSTVQARLNAYSLLLSRAVIRIGLPVKADSEFELAMVDDPYGHASATQLSLFRRPLPTTNLRFLTTINWDGRATPATDLTNIRLGLKNQSNGASVNHGQAPAPIADDVREAIVNFELTLHTAQSRDFQAGDLTVQGATGGPIPLLTLPFSNGLNAPGPGFNPNVFTVFAAWDNQNQNRDRIAEGEKIFNNRTFTTMTPSGPVETTCSGCHTMPNVGSHSVFRLFDIGISAPERRSPAVPLYTFRHKMTMETIQTTDPGRALISGLWSDMNKFKVPGLRALAARPPYFHDGSAPTIAAVVDHYNQRFSIGFTATERTNLIAFLASL